MSTENKRPKHKFSKEFRDARRKARDKSWPAKNPSPAADSPGTSDAPGGPDKETSPGAGSRTPPAPPPASSDAQAAPHARDSEPAAPASAPSDAAAEETFPVPPQVAVAADAKPRVPPRPLSVDAADALEVEPFWVPPGTDLHKWTPEMRREIARLINPIYHELVVIARPGLAQSTGLTIVHLMWLEILDQIEIARAQQECGGDKFLQSVVQRGNPRQQMIERHLRLVSAKIKASDFLRRLNEFGESFWMSYRKHSPGLAERPHRPRRMDEFGKNEYC